MLDWQLGVCPIHAERPAGSNPRDGDNFALIETEINKRLDLHVQTATDWPLVSKLAATILREEGKDLSVATWLLLAWTYCEGAAGLAAGVRVLHDVHVQHWDAMTPPVTRLRGRRNQMEWLLQELEAVLAKNSENWSALEPNQHVALLSDWDALDALWQEYDDQAPALFKLRRMLTELAPAEDDDAADAAGEPDTPLPDASDVTAASGLSGSGEQESGVLMQAEQKPEASGGAGEGSETLPSTVQPAANRTGPGVPASGPGASANNTVTGNDDAVPDSADAIERVIEQGFDAMHTVLQDLPDELIMMPALYRLNRVRAWLTLDALPPDADGVSRIPAPPPADQDGLQGLIDAADARSVLRFAESRLVLHRFWLDLNRIAYQAAQALPGGQPVADAIAMESLYFTQRMPGVQQLAFINGQPFADPATRDWLASLGGAKVIVTGQSADTGSARPDVPAGTLNMATLLAAAGAETQAAARLLDVVAARLQSGSESLADR